MKQVYVGLTEEKIGKAFDEVMSDRAARGRAPESIFKGDPDMGLLNYMGAEEISKVWEACMPKFMKNTGTIVVFGTTGEI